MMLITEDEKKKMKLVRYMKYSVIDDKFLNVSVLSNKSYVFIYPALKISDVVQYIIFSPKFLNTWMIFRTVPPFLYFKFIIYIRSKYLIFTVFIFDPLGKRQNQRHYSI